MYETMVKAHTWVSPPCAMRYADETNEKCCLERCPMCQLPMEDHGESISAEEDGGQTENQNSEEERQEETGEASDGVSIVEI